MLGERNGHLDTLLLGMDDASMTWAQRIVSRCGNPLRLPAETTGISIERAGWCNFPGERSTNVEVMVGACGDGPGRTIAAAGTAVRFGIGI